MARGAYASFQSMASEPRQVWGDLATSAFVQGSHLFRTLGEEETRDLLKLAVSQEFAPGERILAEGGTADDFYLVRDGIAAVTASRDGRSVELGLLEKGAFFGEFRLLAGVPHVASVTARTGLTVVRFPAPMIAALAGRHAKVRTLLEAVMAGREKENLARLST
jgi:CRP-like cAMP-binding protein